jgi:hypothetical protein
MGGRWTTVESFPANCFSCGADLECVLPSTYCDLTHSDVAGQPDTYVCKALPAPCASSPTCACVATMVSNDKCTEKSPGQLVVEHAGG